MCRNSPTSRDVIALVGSQCDAAIAGNVSTISRAASRSAAHRLCRARGHNQSVAFSVSRWRDRLAPLHCPALAGLHCIRVGCGAVGIIAAFFRRGVYRWIRAALFARSRRWLLIIINTRKLSAPPMLPARFHHGEVLIREQTSPFRLFQNGIKEARQCRQPVDVDGSC